MEIDLQGENISVFRVNLGMWPLKLIVSENWACSDISNIYLWGFQEDRWENVHFLSQEPQMIHIG